MTHQTNDAEAVLAALLDPGARPEAPAAFRLAVIERAFAARHARAARRRAVKLAAIGAGFGLAAPAIGAAGLPLETMEPATLAALAVVGALALAAVLILGPARAFAFAPRLFGVR